MNLIDRMQQSDHEQVIAYSNAASGLRCFLAIHDTTLGPALGGVRVWRYATEEEALEDVLRLSRGMTYKASLAGLPAGGGKTVILLHDGIQRAEAFETFGALVESLGGRYFTARDVGITDDDLASIARTTRFVAREPSPELGDISEHTAIGVWHAMRACLEFAGLAPAADRRLRVAIQGVGSVGILLARILKNEGFELVVADVGGSKADLAHKELGATVVSPDEILSTPCDVLSPCALGGILTAGSIVRLQTRIVCGSANNMLAAPEIGDSLARAGVIYAPDYLANAGGLIRGAEYYLLGRVDSRDSLERIYPRMKEVLERAQATGNSTARVADEMAEARLKRPRTHRNVHWVGGVHRFSSA